MKSSSSSQKNTKAPSFRLSELEKQKAQTVAVQKKRLRPIEERSLFFRAYIASPAKHCHCKAFLSLTPTKGGIPLLLKKLPHDFTICKARSLEDIDLDADFYFLARTDEELSLVCRTEDVPAATTERSDGWRGFRIEGVLDFSLVGILSRLSNILAAHRIGIFAVSTFNTDYILVKEENFLRALAALEEAGYEVR